MTSSISTRLDLPSQRPAQHTAEATTTSTARGVVFDIDGTLAVSSSVHLDALAETAQSALGIAAAFEMRGERPYLNGALVAGWVDAQCFHHLAREAGRVLSGEELAEITAEYVSSYCAKLAAGAPAGSLLPGVVQMLETLEEGGILLGLSTGNAAGIAGAKLSAMGIAHFFTFEDSLGFGGAHPDRSHVAVAGVRGLATSGAKFLVGDTISDMKAAQAAQVSGLGVVTGAALPTDLLDAGATAVLADASEVAGYLGLVEGWFPRRVAGLTSAADLFLG